MYSSGPNNSVVLNKRVGGIFVFPFKGENACWCMGIFQILLGEKMHFCRIFFGINSRVDMPITLKSLIKKQGGYVVFLVE